MSRTQGPYAEFPSSSSSLPRPHRVGGNSGTILSPAKGEVLVKAESMYLDPIAWRVHVSSSTSASTSGSTSASPFASAYGTAKNFNQVGGMNGPGKGTRTVLGTAIAGEVKAVGQGVNTIYVNDRICFRWTALDGNDYGVFKEYVLLPAEIAIKIPPAFTYTQAAQMAIGVSTGGPDGGPSFIASVTSSNQKALVIDRSHGVGSPGPVPRTIAATNETRCSSVDGCYWGNFVSKKSTLNTQVVVIQRQ